MKKMNRIGSIRGNLILYSLSIILLMTVLSLYSLGIMNRYRRQIDTMFEKHIYLSEIEENLKIIDQNLLGFLSSKSSTRLNNFLIGIDKLEKQVTNFYNTGLVNDDLMMKNIANLINQYEIEADLAITYKRQRNVQEYYKHYERSIKIQNFIYDYITQMNEQQIDINSVAYLELAKHTKLLQVITMVIVINLIVFSLLIVYLITSKMVKPFSKLYNAAEEIAKGNFDTEDVIIHSDLEFKLLAEAFNNMKRSISSHIGELKLKVEMEVKLKDEQMKNSKMGYLLDSAKLSALQSQVNPHFLYNTINAGVQLSIIEKAHKTGQFLESMSRLFRYNLQKANGECTLEDEINNVKDYYDLLKARFRERIRFEFDIDNKALSLEMPPMVLQPLVENSYIHGLSDLEEGGTITITVRKEEKFARISIRDTGVGMRKAIIDDILCREPEKKQTFGIGIRNVRDRLELFYHKTDIFYMKSKLGEGVETIIEIPIVVKRLKKNLGVTKCLD
ncbi:MAG: hypothetical protein COA82_01745 [Alkaliphilus sp.]|nr:MAG: hypothetical protein COA82_01745 [Alkaliphilus sp.]